MQGKLLPRENTLGKCIGITRVEGSAQRLEGDFSVYMVSFLDDCLMSLFLQQHLFKKNKKQHQKSNEKTPPKHRNNKKK